MGSTVDDLLRQRYVHRFIASCFPEARQTVRLRFDSNHLLAELDESVMGCDRVRIVVRGDGADRTLAAVRFHRDNCGDGLYKAGENDCRPCEACDASQGLHRTGCGRTSPGPTGEERWEREGMR